MNKFLTQRGNFTYVMIVFCLIFLFISCSQYTDTNQILPDLIKQVKPSVVGLGFVEGEGKVNLIGSGFIINKERYIVTANHVISDFISSDKIKNLVAVYFTGKDHKYSSVRWITRDDKLDIAILSFIKNDLIIPYLKIDVKNNFKEGENIIICGFPGGEKYGMKMTTHFGIISSCKERSDNTPIIQMNIISYPGFSGGPVVSTRTKKVIGYVIGNIVNETGISYALPASNISFLLTEIQKRVVK